MARNEANTSHGDWVPYHQRNLPSQPPGGGGGTGTTLGRASFLAESTLVTTTVTAAAAPAGEGRVGKAARRRTRASRKTPTTTLNTDTTNFRAMVQQFTGAPSGPFSDTAAAGSGGGRPTTLSFGHAQPHQQQQQLAAFPFSIPQQFPQYQQYHEIPPFIVGGGWVRVGDGDGDGDVFLQGYDLGGGNPSTTRGDMEVSDGYLPLGSVSCSSSSTGCRTSDGFLF